MAPSREGGDSGTEVAFCVHVDTSFGETVRLVGGTQALGEWKPLDGVALITGPLSYPCWSGKVQLTDDQCLGVSVEFKFVIMRQDGSTSWEPGPNRRLVVQQALPVAGAGSPVGLEQLPMLRFGEHTEELIVHPLPRAKSGGVCRQDSIASTCGLLDFDAEEDGFSTGLSSRCVSWSCLQQELGPAMALWAGAHRTPKPGGRCEDSFFFSALGAGVADGVGQMADYAEHGVDAAAYAAELMKNAAEALAKEVPGSPSQRAASAVAAAETEATTFGASTVTVLAIDSNGAGIANLGDSGYMHLRAKPWGMEIVDRSREQNHGWNCPYQLTRVPKALAAGCVDRFDSAADCDLYQLNVQAGDLLLLYTDGLTDNLHWFEILRVINDTVGPDPACTELRPPPESVAQALVLAAQERSLDAEASTPFERGARRHRVECSGGKIDDITVVAAWIVPDSDEHVTTQVPMLGLPHCAGKSRELKIES
mmetsp:Transcript_21341/g.67584  ORF Transcript_21341/g.67584 Transcript_21341/m.67584 type:complete len:480 (-) Transcript_21341:100-1539(-)